MGALPACCWKELAETPHPLPLIQSPTPSRLHTNTLQRAPELCHLWHEEDRVAQFSSDLLRRSQHYSLCVSLQRSTGGQSHVSQIVGRVGGWFICRLNVNLLGRGCDLGVWHSIIKGCTGHLFTRHPDLKGRGSRSYQFPRSSPGFMGFKELCLGAPKTSVWDVKCTWVFQAIKIRHSDNALTF
jgi:hypothetical protein